MVVEDVTLEVCRGGQSVGGWFCEAEACAAWCGAGQEGGERVHVADVRALRSCCVLVLRRAAGLTVADHCAYKCKCE